MFPFRSRRRRAYAGQGWANVDAFWAAAFFLALVAAVSNPAFILVALAILLANVVRVVLHFALKRRRERKNADMPFWADQIKDT